MAVFSRTVSAILRAVVAREPIVDARDPVLAGPAAPPHDDHVRPGGLDISVRTGVSFPGSPFRFGAVVFGDVRFVPAPPLLCSGGPTPPVYPAIGGVPLHVLGTRTAV